MFKIWRKKKGGGCQTKHDWLHAEMINVAVPLFQICVFLFTCLYMVCYLILTHFKKPAEFVTGEFYQSRLSCTRNLFIKKAYRELPQARKTTTLTKHTGYVNVLQFLSVECVGNILSIQELPALFDLNLFLFCSVFIAFIFFEETLHSCQQVFFLTEGCWI